MMCRHFALTLLAVAAVSLAGCGSNTGPALGQVTGLVVLDGKPLPNAMVSFYPDGGGRSAHGMTDASGKYLLRFTGLKDGALVDTHKVKIETGVRLTESETQPQRNEKIVQLPGRYNQETELTATVNRGKNVCDFELQSK